VFGDERTFLFVVCLSTNLNWEQ